METILVDGIVQAFLYADWERHSARKIFRSRLVHVESQILARKPRYPTKNARPATTYRRSKPATWGFLLIESANPQRTTKLEHFQWDTSVFVLEYPLFGALF